MRYQLPTAKFEHTRLAVMPLASARAKRPAKWEAMRGDARLERVCAGVCGHRMSPRLMSKQVVSNRMEV